jgi:hypothetical protein
MDIEGAEYGVLLETDSTILEKFRIIIIEFHNFDNLLSADGFDLIDIVFKKILKNFMVVHVHPNNYAAMKKYKNFVIPAVVEYTFMRKDRVKTMRPIEEYPHILDRPCSEFGADVPLPDCFYKN